VFLFDDFKCFFCYLYELSHGKTMFVDSSPKHSLGLVGQMEGLEV